MNPRERALIDLFAAIEGLSGSALECPHYPCHYEGQDCSLCYCPFYPCLIYRLGGEIVVSSSGKYVWSCKDCHWIHEKENVEEVLSYFSSFPRQLLVEADWRFFSKSLQEILFGEEIGFEINNAYNLTPANIYGFECEPLSEGQFLDVSIENFMISDIRKLSEPERAEGVIIPEKSGRVLIGYHNGFLKCTF
uniref:Cysteine-rich small domain-containing protein n=1 Tax=Archaeoglobus fulgidus TaxID=2234 RepID=A0A7C3M9A6_ARCFL